jgi:hypothetical protein
MMKRSSKKKSGECRSAALKARCLREIRAYLRICDEEDLHRIDARWWKWRLGDDWFPELVPFLKADSALSNFSDARLVEAADRELERLLGAVVYAAYRKQDFDQLLRLVKALQKLQTHRAGRAESLWTFVYAMAFSDPDPRKADPFEQPIISPTQAMAYLKLHRFEIDPKTTRRICDQIGLARSHRRGRPRKKKGINPI